MDKQWLIIFILSVTMSFFLGSLIDTPTYAEYINTHDVIFVGVLGFAGTAIGGFLIGWQIKQKEKHRIEELLLKKKSVRACLCSEIVSNKETLESVIQFMNTGNNSAVFTFQRELYKSNISSLGILSAEQVFLVSFFYQMETALTENFEVLLEHAHGKLPIDLTEKDQEVINNVKQTIKQSIKHAELARDSLLSDSDLAEVFKKYEFTGGVSYVGTK